MNSTETGMEFFHVDHSSVATGTRAAIEALLTFKYLFVNDDVELSKFRHGLWKLSGLNNRSKLYARTPDSIEVLRCEAEIMAVLKEEIFGSRFYIEANREVKKSIKKCSWKPVGGWHALSGEANIHERFFSDVYNYLSGHSHASYISALQIRDATDVKDQRMLAKASRHMLCLVLSHLLFSYVDLFPESKELLMADSLLFDVASTWYIRAEDHDKLYS